MPYRRSFYLDSIQHGVSRGCLTRGNQSQSPIRQGYPEDLRRFDFYFDPGEFTRGVKWSWTDERRSRQTTRGYTGLRLINQGLFGIGICKISVRLIQKRCAEFLAVITNQALDTHRSPSYLCIFPAGLLIRSARDH